MWLEAQKIEWNVVQELTVADTKREIRPTVIQEH